MKKTLLLLCLALLAACRSAPPPGPPVPPPIRSIGVVAGDALSELVSTELVDRGYRTFQLPATQQLALTALQALGSRGVDAVLVITSDKALDSLPNNASLRLMRTLNGETVATQTWSNVTQGAVRKSRAEAARELVHALLQTIR